MAEAPTAPAASAWDLAITVARLLAVDPAGVGGVRVRAAPGPARDVWLEGLLQLWGAAGPVRRLPPGADEARVSGGLDLAATLSSGRPVMRAGLLAEAASGLLIVPGADRLEPARAAQIAHARDGAQLIPPAVIPAEHGAAPADPAQRRDLPRSEPVAAPNATVVGPVSAPHRSALQRARDDTGWAPGPALILFDEAAEGEPGLAPCLCERAAFTIDFTGVTRADLARPWPAPADIAAARARRAAWFSPDDDVAEALVIAAHALGVDSARAALQALAVARAQAALEGRIAASDEDAALAARLVLAPRATRIPAAPEAEATPPEAPPTPPHAAEADCPNTSEPQDIDPRALADILVAAAAAALPASLIAGLAGGDGGRRPGAGRGPGARAPTKGRGRPAGLRRGDPRRGDRIDLVATLTAAAPWRALRTAPPGALLAVRPEDFRTRKRKRRPETLTVFAVDASGSAAFQRLGEAKGAVELLLGRAYVDRSRVALVGFRGTGAEVLLPPTRALARARRALADLPGGGATPLAAGLALALRLATDGARSGSRAELVVLTDGRANVAADGTLDRARGTADALAAARAVAAAGVPAVLVDTSPRPREPARDLAAAMGARYVALPTADPRRLAEAVSGAHGDGGAGGSR